MTDGRRISAGIVVRPRGKDSSRARSITVSVGAVRFLLFPRSPQGGAGQRAAGEKD